MVRRSEAYLARIIPLLGAVTVGVIPLLDCPTAYLRVGGGVRLGLLGLGGSHGYCWG